LIYWNKEETNYDKICQEERFNMRKPLLNMKILISDNKKDILANKKEMARIEKQIDERHMKQLKAYK
jgi:hypothetical protein